MLSPERFFMFTHMKNLLLWSGLLLTALTCVSCVDAPEKKPVGPVSENSAIPWNSQRPGEGQGQFGMLPQNQYRR